MSINQMLIVLGILVSSLVSGALSHMAGEQWRWVSSYMFVYAFIIIFFSAVDWLVVFLTASSATSLSSGRRPRLTSDSFTCCHAETEWGDHDFCLSRSHYTDTNPIKWGAGARIFSSIKAKLFAQLVRLNYYDLNLRYELER